MRACAASTVFSGNLALAIAFQAGNEDEPRINAGFSQHSVGIDDYHASQTIPVPRFDQLLRLEAGSN
jgi:hypothetical protein